jgi:hypothetical protein
MFSPFPISPPLFGADPPAGMRPRAGSRCAPLTASPTSGNVRRTLCAVRSLACRSSPGSPISSRLCAQASVPRSIGCSRLSTASCTVVHTLNWLAGGRDNPEHDGPRPRDVPALHGPRTRFHCPPGSQPFLRPRRRAMRQIIADYARYEGARSGVAPTRSRRSQAAGRIDAEDPPRLMALDRILVSSRAQLPV